MSQTLYRAADNEVVGVGACFARQQCDAEAYLDNPGFGGSTLYTATVCDDHVLRLVGSDGRERKNAKRMLAEALTADTDAQDALMEDWQSQGAYVHDVIDALTERQQRRLARDYSWIVYEDSYPEGCECWVLLDTDAVLSIERAE